MAALKIGVEREYQGIFDIRTFWVPGFRALISSGDKGGKMNEVGHCRHKE